MRLRLTKIDEYQFLTCLKHGLWGSKSARFKEWEKGDGLVFIIGKALAAFAEVSGSPFSSKETIWDDGMFPYRIPLIFRHVLDHDERIPILGKVRQALTDSWGPKYGWGILDQSPMSDDTARIILEELRSKPNSLPKFENELNQRMSQAKLERSTVVISRSVKVPRDLEPHVGRDLPPEDTRLHTKLQRILIELGNATGSLVWIAANDRVKATSNTEKSGCLSELPSMGLNDEAMRRISYIDVLWVRQNAPVCAFEVETTTSVYSGLLRMSDLLAVVPALKLDLFVIAPKERQQKVMGELARPTFAKLGLSEYCRFIASEDLEDLAQRARGLSGHLRPSVLDTIAIALEE